MTKSERTAPLSTKDKQFRSVVQQWLHEQGEILVLLRYSRAAGAKDWYFAEEPNQLLSMVDSLPSQTSVILFRDQQLPIRGVADQALIEAAKTLIPDGTEFLVLRLEPERIRTSESSAERMLTQAGESLTELREAIRDFHGHRVAIGQYPRFWEDNDNVLEGIVPSTDGAVEIGVY